jgi:hypothetical protein
MTFVKRRIDVTISLGEGTFGDDKGSDVTLSGLRAKASIVTVSGDVQGQLQLSLYGLPLSMINQLTRIGPIMNQVRNNSILVAAGDEGGAMSTVYQGTIWQAYGQFQSAPDVSFTVVALAGLIEAVKPVGATSYRGNTDVATIMQTLATSAGLAFQNNGVSIQLSSPYFAGTALNQIKSCARAANIYYAIERGSLGIWPKAGRRSGDAIKISPATGLLGYPTFWGNGLELTTLFNPDVAVGMAVEVDSSLSVANGTWNVFNVTHALESETPGGAWFTTIQCGRLAA